jgi:hypothetical protein
MVVKSGNVNPQTPAFMKFSISSFLLSIFLLLLAVIRPAAVCAQDEPEYKMEIGAGVGLMNYLGDFNGSLLKDFQPMGGIVAKYKSNPRVAWSALLSYGTLKGDSKNANTWYPEYADQPVTFKTNLTDFSLKFEYNFWPYGTGREYYGAKPLTPYITLGAGLAFAKNDESVVAFQTPIGFGVKYKLKSRLNLSAEWLMHISGSDKLDGISDPYGIKSTELFKNTDCYSTFMVALTYEFMEKCKTCHNDRE